MNDPDCPRCKAVRIVKNGHAHTGKQRYLCRICGYQFTLNPSWHPVPADKIALVDELLSERLSHRGICRVAGVSRSWFRLHIHALVRSVPHSIDPEKVVSTKG